ncbi:3-hydroxyisobutyryl-CoA hydrolase [Kocuria dechangensis]|uniref:3-hydroxyisobutyryl-CoA hydrolase n=1 Tax=Kocuria dechangensis TaxID=1176249 RepID=A0A917H2I5_9MICC|nr:enoyl-CoA hydratase/isomerase family protein [Kocuria dechangensis]GGG65500.1 3-hydroxyisobutyryl-CoA hydrolase [Kocuria dechangensis]
MTDIATHPADTDQYVLTQVRNGTGHIVLNRPRQLNALTAQMYHDLKAALDAWKDDDAVEHVLVTSASPKAWCAGGDIREVRDAVLGGRVEAAGRVFAVEYALDYLISAYPKPYVALMNGICMGGGMGISVHGSHRVVGHSTVMAMPETRIGFFTDIGASWFLPRVSRPDRRGEPSLAVGRYLALGGQRFSGADAVALGLADRFVADEDFGALAAAVVEEGPEAALARYAREPEPSPLVSRWDEIEERYGASSLEEIVAAAPEDLAGMSPSSLVRTFELLERGAADDSVRSCLERELRLAVDMIARPDFAEGVRAVVVDKDNSPVWEHASVADVDVAAVRAVLDEKLPLPL